MSRRGPMDSLRLVLASVLVTAAVAAAAGCSDTKFGAPCSLPAAAPSPTTYHLDANAVACPSRLCLLPAEQVTTDTGALCSQDCQTDADCEEGQTRDDHNVGDMRCKSGFSCQPIPLVPDSSGAASCRKMCACRDFLEGSATPPAGCS